MLKLIGLIVIGLLVLALFNYTEISYERLQHADGDRGRLVIEWSWDFEKLG